MAVMLLEVLATSPVFLRFLYSTDLTGSLFFEVVLTLLDFDMGFSPVAFFFWCGVNSPIIWQLDSWTDPDFNCLAAATRAFLWWKLLVGVCLPWKPNWIDFPVGWLSIFDLIVCQTGSTSFACGYLFYIFTACRGILSRESISQSFLYPQPRDALSGSVRQPFSFLGSP